MAIIGQPPFIAMSNKKTFFQKTISSILIVVLSVNTTSTVVFAADSIMQNAQLGETFANSLKDSIVMPSESGGVLTLPSSGQGNPVQININDLYPGTSSTNERDASFYFPDGNMPTVEQMINAGDSESGLNNEGTTANQYLGSDALLDNPSLAGAGYQIALDQARTPSRDFSNDPMLNQTRDIVDNMDIIAQEFGDCTEETSYFDTSFEAHAPSYERCERVIDESQKCTIEHNYSAAVVKHHSGPLNLQTCGEGCTSMWIGQIGDNYWSGWCSIYEKSTAVTVVNPDAISSVILEYTKWDDYMQVLVGPIGNETLVWQGPNGNFPPETGGACELEESWSSNPNVDITNYFKNAQQGEVVNFKIRVSVSGEGEGFGRLRINYDPKKVITIDEWSPNGCISAANAIQDSFAEGSLVCSHMPPILQDSARPNEKCMMDGDVKICESFLNPSPIEGISPLCKAVDVDAKFNFYKGDLECFTDANGEYQCPTNDGGNLNSCAKFEQNPQCGFISSKCLEGAQGASGECYVYEDTYDCGSTVRIPTIGVESKYTCAGQIRCMGTECVSPDKGNSEDFARVSALLQAAQTMGQDLSCTGTNEDGGFTGTDDVECTVFAGEDAECKKAVGGIVNCCEKPSGISLADYVGLVLAVPKLDTAIMSIGKDSSFKIIKSGYEALREPIVGAFQEISKPFTGLLDNVTGAIDSVKGAIDGVLDQLKEKMVDMFNQVFGNVAAETGAGAAGGVAAGPAAEQAGEQIVNNIGSALSVIGNIYTIYSVTMLAIKMIYKCTEKELELNVQRVLKNTHYIGSYCKSEFLGACIEKRETYCMFKSPLSRILQEQVRHQLALSWGTPEEPECQGLTIEQFAEVDWTMVNLDEWLAILGETGNLPDPATMSLQQLTGAGTTLDLGSRIEAETRTMEHFQDIDTEKIRRETSDSHQPYDNYIPAVP